MRSLRGREVAAALAAVLVARTAVNGGVRIVYPFLPEIARGLGVSLATMGTLLALRSLVGVIALAIPGLSSRVGRRALLLTALVATAAGCALVALAGGAPPPYAVVGAGAGLLVANAAKPLFDIPMQAWFGARVPPARRGRILGATELTWALSLALAFPAGLLIAATSWEAALWLVAGAAVLGFGAVLVGMAPDGGATARSPSLVLRGPVVRVLAVVALFRLAAEQLFVVYGAWLETDLGLAITAIGAFTLVVVASELAGEGAVSAFADRVGLRRTVLIGLSGSALAYASLGLVGDSLPGAVASVVVWFVAFEVTIVSTIPLITVIAGEARERALSLLALVAVGAGGIAALIGPRLFELAGIGANGALSAVLVIAAAVVLWTVRTDPHLPVLPSPAAPRG